MKPAILIVDVLRDFFQDSPLKEHETELVTSINELTTYARVHDVPVIWIRQEFKQDLSDAPLAIHKGLTKPVTIEGSDGVKLAEGLEIGLNDYDIVKKRYSAFFRTSLFLLLRDLGVNQLIIGGIKTQTCVRATVIDAYQLDFEVLLATNCLYSDDNESRDETLRYLSGVIAQLKTNRELKVILKG